MVQLYLLELLPGRALIVVIRNEMKRRLEQRRGASKGYAYVTADGH